MAFAGGVPRNFNVRSGVTALHTFFDREAGIFQSGHGVSLF